MDLIGQGLTLQAARRALDLQARVAELEAELDRPGAGERLPRPAGRAAESSAVPRLRPPLSTFTRLVLRSIASGCPMGAACRERWERSRALRSPVRHADPAGELRCVIG